jgi:hypothetical protein
VNAELLRTGMISPEDMHLFRVTDDVEEAVQEVVQFYRRFHSSRFVGELFVIRMNSQISDECLESLNDTYGDIVTGGSIEKHPGPLPGEHNEHPDKPRLSLQFDRKSSGKLRLLIDAINREPQQTG